MNAIAYWVVLVILATAFGAISYKLLFDHAFREDMRASENNIAFGKLSVQGAAVTGLLIFLICGLIYVAQRLEKLPPVIVPPPRMEESEKPIRAYYKHINNGIAGNQRGFREAWNLLSEAFQIKKAEKYKGYKFPDEYGRLYSNSGQHEIVACVKDSGSEASGYVIYYVVFKLTEPHFPNPFFDYFSPPTKKTVQDLSIILANDRITSNIKERITNYYKIPSDFKWELFRTRINGTCLNRLISPRLLTEIAADFKFDKLESSQGQPIGFLEDRYNVYQGDKILVVRVGDEWRIDKDTLATFCSYKLEN